MLDTTANITGEQALYATFKKLPRSTQNKALRPALRAGGKVLAKAAADNVEEITGEEATGLLARNIKVYALKKYKGALRVGVMVKRGLLTSKGVRVGLYASVLEYGKDGQPPRSWARRAARESTEPVFNAVAEVASSRMTQAVEDAKR